MCDRATRDARRGTRDAGRATRDAGRATRDAGRATRDAAFSPFWNTFFFGYLDYSSQNVKLGYRDLVRQVNEEAVRNLLAGRLTPTGTHYQKLIAAAR